MTAPTSTRALVAQMADELHMMFGPRDDSDGVFRSIAAAAREPEREGQGIGDGMSSSDKSLTSTSPAPSRDDDVETVREFVKLTGLAETPRVLAALDRLAALAKGGA